MSTHDTAEPDDIPAQPKFLPDIDPKFLTTKDPNETPIFSRHRLQVRIPETSRGDIMHLAISRNWFAGILTTAKQVTLVRVFLKRVLPPSEISLEKYLAGYKISKLFMDFTGHHIIISLIPKSPGLCADFLYVHGNTAKVRRIEKFKDHEITAVAFNNYAGTENATAAILLGTSRGLIFETELNQETEKPLYRKQVYDLGLGRAWYPITSLELLRMANSNKYIVVAATPDCIYTFQEVLRPDEKSLQPIFTTYVNGTQVHGTIEVKTDLTYSVFRYFAPANERYAKNWGWLCGAGIRIGEVSTDTNSADVLLGDDTIKLDFVERQHLSYEQRRQCVPISFVLTEHHALLLYPDHITGICLLNQEVVYEEYFHENTGKLLNVLRDPFSGTLYVYTDKAVYDFRITDEERNIWKIYLDKENYEMAERYAADNSDNLDIVLTKKADSAYNAKDYTAAANIYAETSNPFEGICLKFMELEDKHPIIQYVKKRLEKIMESPDHVILLVIWLTDLYLTQINYPGRASSERAQWQREFDEFVADERIAAAMRENNVAIQKLINEHADTHNLIKFAISNGDYEEVIKQQILSEQYKDALASLSKQKNSVLYYKFCPLLIDHLPRETVDLLIAQGRKLDAKELITTLAVIKTPQHIEEIIKYIEHAIYNLGEEDDAIHNYLLRLYSEHKPAKLISYLKNEGTDISLVHYDVNYALLTCSNYDAKEASVFLKCLVGMWPAAVELALTFDLKLAKETASKPKDDEMRHDLWLSIAQHCIQGTNDVEKALELLKECDLLHIEDLLPFFSDFEKIDDFKKPICDALKDYNSKIQELQHDMNEYTKQADRVCEDLQNIRDRCVRIEAHENCSICETFLMVKPFFVFACGHKFHSDCLEKHVVPMLTSDQSRKLTMLKQQLETLLTESIASGNHSQQQRFKRDKIKKEIEEIVAADCLYCGLLIETIDQPFVVDWDQIHVDWE
ncbi:vacuolar protein sorting-associated protein 18 homolog [Teleopsis dalmanni]|uniref:vacuolar protein sorting-associated protein 18 homolog n=1 Tax=Teleopsis dalmanni TaxID=139649 RepID=UPI000D32B5FB|nr:vacuolar protein sorting-associated protein 18 homolog [Teleopsis dalmanni]